MQVFILIKSNGSCNNYKPGEKRNPIKSYLGSVIDSLISTSTHTIDVGGQTHPALTKRIKSKWRTGGKHVTFEHQNPDYR